jgi:hypothetical protein
MNETFSNEAVCSETQLSCTTIIAPIFCIIFFSSRRFVQRFSNICERDMKQRIITEIVRICNKISWRQHRRFSSYYVEFQSNNDVNHVAWRFVARSRERRIKECRSMRNNRSTIAQFWSFICHALLVSGIAMAAKGIAKLSTSSPRLAFGDAMRGSAGCAPFGRRRIDARPGAAARHEPFRRSAVAVPHPRNARRDRWSRDDGDPALSRPAKGARRTALSRPAILPPRLTAGRATD